MHAVSENFGEEKDEYHEVKEKKCLNFELDFEEEDFKAMLYYLKNTPNWISAYVNFDAFNYIKSQI